MIVGPCSYLGAQFIQYQLSSCTYQQVIDRITLSKEPISVQMISTLGPQVL